MDLHALPHSKEASWKTSGLAWLLDIYDWDHVLVEQDVGAELSFGLKLCVAFFPCSMKIKGDPVGVIQRKGSGHISCLSSDGCQSLVLEHIKFFCEHFKPQNSTFKIQGSYLAIFNSSFNGCISREDGGVIQSFDKSIVVIDRSNFSDSVSTGFGGAVSAYGGSVHVFSSSFSDLHASRGGGAIWSSAYQSCYGLSQYYNAVLELIGSDFANCTTDGNGGAILMTADASESGLSNEILAVAIHSSTLSSCKSSRFGGALYLTGSVTAKLNSTSIYSCESTYSGGAVFARNGVTLFLDGSVMHGNVAFVCGGAIWANNSGIRLVDSVLNNNSALGFGGGAMFLEKTSIFFNRTTFSGNRAPAGGGGVLLTQGLATPSSADIAHVCSQDNFAAYGPCLASECKSLRLTYDSSSSFWSGLPFKITIEKLDAYQQTIVTDSSTFVQFLPSKSDINGVDTLEDLNPSFSFVGSDVSRFSQGVASVEFAIKATFVEINSSKVLARIKTQPHFFAQSPDMQTGLIMKSQVVSIKLEESGNVCPQGYVLDLDSQVSLPTVGACKLCKQGTYSLDPLEGPNKIPECFKCPSGAKCLEGGGIRYEIGNWTPVNGMLVLVHCPDGYTLRSTLSSGSADVQECQPCLETQYILRPDIDACQKCPTGLKCVGTDAYEPRLENSTWVRNGSIYRLLDCPAGYSVVSSTGISEPFDATVQQCSPCLKGEECVYGPCVSCSPCKPGFYKSIVSAEHCSSCPSDTFSESFGGLDLPSCISCPKNAGTFGKRGQSNFSSCMCKQGYYMDHVSQRDAKTCLVCPVGASCLNGQPPLFGSTVDFSLSLSGITALDVCCYPTIKETILNGLAKSLSIERTHISLPAIFCQDHINTCSSTGRRLQTGVVLTFTAVSRNYTSLSNILQSPAFIAEFAVEANIPFDSISVQTPSMLTDTEEASQNVYGPVDSAGQYPLIGCSPGFLLINDSVSTQHCFECALGKYSVDFMDGCRGLSKCSSGRSCNKCPIGATCSGKSDFTKVLASSIWEAAYDPSSMITIMKIVSCPKGFQLINSTEGTSSGTFAPESQQCFACPYGKYIVEPNSDSCTTCPKGASCDGISFIPNTNLSIWRVETGLSGGNFMRVYQCPAGYTMTRNELYPTDDNCVECGVNEYLLSPITIENQSIACAKCPVGGICPGANVVIAKADFWKRVEYKSLNSSSQQSQAALYQCPPAYCLGSVDSMIPSAANYAYICCYLSCKCRNNECANNRTGLICAECSISSVMTAYGCEECPSEEVIEPLRNAAMSIGITVISVLWVCYSWSPFLPPVGTYMSERCVSFCDKSVSASGTFSNLSEFLAKCMVIVARMKLAQYSKIFISYLQVMSSFMGFQVEWPPAILGAMMWCNVTFNLSLLSLPGISCLWKGLNYNSKLVAYTVIPLCLGFMLFVPLLVVSMLERIQRHPEEQKKFLRKSEIVKDRSWSAIMLLCFLVYPQLSNISFEPFNCQPEALGLLAADVRMLCPSIFSFTRIWAIASIFVYPVGIPVFSIWVMMHMGVDQLAKQKINAALVSEMINVYIKQTTSVESQRVSQLFGTVQGSNFQEQVRELYRLFFSEDSECNSGVTSFCNRKIEVTVVSIKNLPKTDLLGSVDPFCQLEYAGTVHQTTVKAGECNPNWEGESISFEINKDDLSMQTGTNSILQIRVLDWDRFKSNEFIGRVDISGQILNNVIASSSADHTELEICLSNNGERVCNAEGSPSTLNIRLKNAGLVISGIPFSDMKKLFSSYDTNIDGIVSEDEFFSTVKQILEVTRIFTGSETGDVKLLSAAQVSALLNHKWIIPGNELKSPLENFISNIQNQTEVQKLTPSQGDKSADNQIQKGDERNNEAFQSTRAVGNCLKTMEESCEDLLALAKTLRASGVIALPALLWGAETDCSPDSPESIAIRRVGFVFMGYSVQYWYWESVEMLRKFLMTSLLLNLIAVGEPVQVAAGMIITFCFLVLYTAVQPYCTPSLSKTQACCLISQFFSLFAGICLIVNSYIRNDLMNAGQPDTTGQSSYVFDVLIAGVNLVICAWPFVLFVMYGTFAEKWEVISTKCKSVFNSRNQSGSKSISDIKEYNSIRTELEGTHTCMKEECAVAIHLGQPSTNADKIESDATVTESLPCPLQLIRELNVSHQQHLELPQAETNSGVVGKSVTVARPPELVNSAQIPCFSTPPPSGTGQFVWLTE